MSKEVTCTTKEALREISKKRGAKIVLIVPAEDFGSFYVG